MEVGELTIGARIDTTSIQESMMRLTSSLDEVGAKFDSVNSDMTRTEKSAQGISLGFLSIVGATTAIYGLAKSAPQLAGAMAEMQISMMQISFTLGDALAPAFETASQGLRDFAQWLQENDEGVKTLGDAINGTLIVAIEGLKVAWGIIEGIGIPGAFKWLIDNFGPNSVGAGILTLFLSWKTLGFLGGATAGMGAMIGYAGGEAISGESMLNFKGNEEKTGESMRGELMGLGALGGVGLGLSLTGVGLIPGIILTALSGLGAYAYGEKIEKTKYYNPSNNNSITEDDYRIISRIARNETNKVIYLNSTDNYL